MMRFFATADIELYEQIRADLNQAWGLPDSSGTVTCISPATEYSVGSVLLTAAPRDSDGRIVLSVDDAWCEWSPVDSLLPQLLAAGVVAEITEADYLASLPTI